MNELRQEQFQSADDAAAYDAWFRAEVEEAIREADDPNTVWISNEDAHASWAARRTELLALMSKPGG